MYGAGIAAFVLFVIATILAWLGKDHASAVAYAGLACLAIQGVIPFTRWGRSGG